MSKIKPIRSDVFLIVDVQNDFCPGGALAVSEGDQVIPVINRLVDHFNSVVLTQDWHPKEHTCFASSHPGHEPFSMIKMPYGDQVLWPDHCVQETEGAAFSSELRSARANLVIRKGFDPQIDSYSAFHENDRATSTGLAGYLRERGTNRVFLCGLALDFCVRYSAEDAVRHGFDVVLVEDACRAIDLDSSLDEARQAFRTTGVTVVDSTAIAS